jgi:hypothetical protein
VLVLRGELGRRPGRIGVPAAPGASGLIGVWESVGSTWTGTVRALDRAPSDGAG